MKHEELRMKSCIFASVLLLLSCNHSSDVNGGELIIEQPQTKWQCEGHASFWTDTGPGPDNVPMTALWHRSEDSSSAALYTWIKFEFDTATRPDSIYFARDSMGWHFAPFDQRFQYGWDPYITETTDSVIIGMGFGFSGSDYYLRKQ